MLICMPARSRVIVVEDASLMRDGLAALLGTEPSVQVIGMIANTVAAVRLAAALRPEVAILDFQPINGVQMVAALRGRWPSVYVLALARTEDTELMDAALHAGVEGCLSRSDSRARFMTALRSVAGGSHFISRIRHRAADPPGDTRPAASAGRPPLTDREREVMQWVAAGLRTREIAERLSVSHKTIEKHRSSLMRKLGLRSAAAVAVYAITKGSEKA